MLNNNSNEKYSSWYKKYYCRHFLIDSFDIKRYKNFKSYSKMEDGTFGRHSTRPCRTELIRVMTVRVYGESWKLSQTLYVEHHQT